MVGAIILPFTILFFGALIYLVAITAFQARLGEVARAGDWSTTVRTYGAVLAGWRVMLEHPAFGVGLGNFLAARDTLLITYIELKVPREVAQTDVLFQSIGNGVGALLMFLGLIGSAAYLYVFWRFMTAVTGRHIRLLELVSGFLLMSVIAGNIYSPRIVMGAGAFVLLLSLELVGRSDKRSVDVSAIASSPRREVDDRADSPGQTHNLAAQIRVCT